MSQERGRGVLRQVVALARRRDDARPAFVDGLLLGTMVGAAIAGSTIWSRWQARRRSAVEQAPRPGSGPPREGAEGPSPR